jgi:heme exporter protein C
MEYKTAVDSHTFRIEHEITTPTQSGQSPAATPETPNVHTIVHEKTDMGLVEAASRRRITVPVVGGLGLASFVVMFTMTEPLMYDVNTPVNFIAYWHIALAWTSGIALLVTFGASAQYLRTRSRYWNLLAHSSGEVGFVFLTGTLAMGSIWGSEMWGTYWAWSDVRLVTLFITWLVYLGYLLVFTSTREGEDRYAAVYGVLGFVTIPVSYLSTRIWNPTFHSPTMSGSTGATVIDPTALVLAILGAMGLLVYFLSLRLRTHRLMDVTLERTGGH